MINNSPEGLYDHSSKQDEQGREDEGQKRHHLTPASHHRYLNATTISFTSQKCISITGGRKLICKCNTIARHMKNALTES